MILNKTKGNEVVWLLKGINPGEQAYARLRQLVGGNSVHFAKPSVGSVLQWNSQDTELVAWDRLSAVDKERAKAAMMELRQGINESAPAGTDAMIENVLTCPSEKYVFFNPNTGNLVLSGWGYKFLKPTNDGEDWRLPPKDLAHPVRVAFVNKGQIVPCRGFLIKAKHIDNHYKTGEDGYFKVGDTVQPGTTFNVIDELTGHQFVINVDDKEDYLLDVTEAEKILIRHTGYSVTVVNQDDEPQANYSLVINGATEITDDKGRVVKENIPFSYAMSGLHVEDGQGNKADFVLSEDASCNQFLMRINVHYDCWLIVEVVDADGKRRENHPVRIALLDGILVENTDASGQIRKDNLEPGSNVTVANASDPSCAERITLKRGENKVLIKLSAEPPKPENPVMVRIGFSDIDGSPLQNVEITLDTPIGQYKKVTDEKGNIWLPVSSFRHRKKVRFSFLYNGKRVTRKL